MEMDYPSNQVILAEEIATEAHKEQFRWDKKTPYIEHPKTVVDLLGKFNRWEFTPSDFWKYKCVAWLHDVIEDTDLDFKDLVNKGIYPEIAQIVVMLSRMKGEHYLAYLFRIQKNKIAKIVKLVDLQHNISDLEEGSSRRDKYEMATYILEGDK